MCLRQMIPISEKVAAKRKKNKVDYNVLTDDEMHDLWNKNKVSSDGDDSYFHAMMDELRGMKWDTIHKHRRGRGRGMASIARHELELNKFTVKAINSWDPNHVSGRSLKGHVWSTFHPTGSKNLSVLTEVDRRYGNENVVVKSRSGLIGRARKTVEEFEDTQGRKPIASELAGMLAVPVGEAERVMREMAPTHYMDRIIDTDKNFADGTLTPKLRDAIRTVEMSSNAVDKQLMQRWFYPLLGGMKPAKTQKEWSVELGISQERISNRRVAIEQRIKSLVR